MKTVTFHSAEDLRFPCQATQVGHMFSLSQQETRHQCGKTQDWNLDYNPKACSKFRLLGFFGDLNSWLANVCGQTFERAHRTCVAHPLSYNGPRPGDPHQLTTNNLPYRNPGLGPTRSTLERWFRQLWALTWSTAVDQGSQSFAILPVLVKVGDGQVWDLVLNPSQQPLLWGLLLSIIVPFIFPHRHGDGVMKDQSPYQAQDELQVPIDNGFAIWEDKTTAWSLWVTQKCVQLSGQS